MSVLSVQSILFDSSGVTGNSLYEFQIGITNNKKNVKSSVSIIFNIYGNNNLPNSSSSVLRDCLNFFDAENENEMNSLIIFN